MTAFVAAAFVAADRASGRLGGDLGSVVGSEDHDGVLDQFAPLVPRVVVLFQIVKQPPEGHVVLMDVIKPYRGRFRRHGSPRSFDCLVPDFLVGGVGTVVGIARVVEKEGLPGRILSLEVMLEERDCMIGMPAAKGMKIIGMGSLFNQLLAVSVGAHDPVVVNMAGSPFLPGGVLITYLFLCALRGGCSGIQSGSSVRPGGEAGVVEAMRGGSVKDSLR